MEGVKTKFGRELTHSVGNLSDMSNALTIDQNLQIKHVTTGPKEGLALEERKGQNLYMRVVRAEQTAKFLRGMKNRGWALIGLKPTKLNHVSN